MSQTEFERRHDRDGVLTNNSGTICNERPVTEDDVEATFAFNHFTPFLLTRSLIDQLVTSAPARVFTITLGLHEHGTRTTRLWTCLSES